MSPLQLQKLPVQQEKLNTRENSAVCFGFNYCLFLQHSGQDLNCDTQAEECLFAAV